MIRLVWFLLIIPLAYAGDGDSYLSFVELEDSYVKALQEASCQTNSMNCDFPGKYALFGDFTGQGFEEVMLRSGVPTDAPDYRTELFRFEAGKWRQLGPFKDEDVVERYAFRTGPWCRVLSVKSRTVLVCEDRFYSDLLSTLYVSSRPVYEIWIVDFARQSVETSLFSTRDPLLRTPFCGHIKPNEKLDFLDEFDLSLEDFNGDGREDAVLNLRLTELDASRCVVWEDEQAYIQGSGKPTLNKELVWLFDGISFMPTSETQTFIDYLEANK